LSMYILMEELWETVSEIWNWHATDSLWTNSTLEQNLDQLSSRVFLSVTSDSTVDH
jgi:hypothetical protein